MTVEDARRPLDLTMRTPAPHIRAHQLAQVRGPEAAFPR